MLGFDTFVYDINWESSIKYQLITVVNISGSNQFI